MNTNTCWISAHEAALRGLAHLLGEPGHGGSHLCALPFGSGFGDAFWLGQLGPDGLPIIRTQVATSHSANSGALKSSSQRWGRITTPARYVAKVTYSDDALSSQVSRLLCRDRGEVIFESHDSITSNDVAVVNTA